MGADTDSGERRGGRCEKLQAGIRGHYQQRVDSARPDLPDCRRELLTAFLHGSIFLRICLGLNRIPESILAERFPGILGEGLIIIG